MAASVCEKTRPQCWLRTRRGSSRRVWLEGRPTAAQAQLWPPSVSSVAAGVLVPGVGRWPPRGPAGAHSLAAASREICAAAALLSTGPAPACGCSPGSPPHNSARTRCAPVAMRSFQFVLAAMVAAAASAEVSQPASHVEIRAWARARPWSGRRHLSGCYERAASCQVRCGGLVVARRACCGRACPDQCLSSLTNRARLCRLSTLPRRTSTASWAATSPPLWSSSRP